MSCCGHPVKRAAGACGHGAATGAGEAVARAAAGIRCQQCTLPRALACAQCPARLCLPHWRAHARASGHGAAVLSAPHLQLFCAACDDFVYERAFDLAVRETRAQAAMRRLERAEPEAKRLCFRLWQPTPVDQRALAHAVPLAAPPHLQGLRGLLNLGSTCFMNVVMQTLATAPVFRNFFLADLHNERVCERPQCLMCLVDRFFRALYSCEKKPFAPSGLLFGMWQYSEAFLYEQQDSHEFFISLLSGLHAHSAESSNDQCSCVVHQAFGCVLRSNVKCSSCGFISSSFDPALDLSLEIHDPSLPSTTLEDCLRTFSDPEVLGEEDRLKCGRCGQVQQSEKQMSIETTPVVLALQIKRFQRTMKSKYKMTSSKVETDVVFQPELDITPFLSRSVVAEASKPSAAFTYDLFGVVNHQGTLDNGHYTNFVLRGDDWIRCDDGVLQRVTSREVYQSQAYMLFYLKRYLEYE